MTTEADLSALHVVVGASGATGRVIVRELAARGQRVRAVSRSGGVNLPTHVEEMNADASDPAAIARVCAGAAVVYHCAMPKLSEWMTAFPDITRNLIRAAGAADAALVFADDMWMYGRATGPMSETTPERPVSTKGVLRAWLGEMLLAAHARGDARVTIGRAPELFGPGVRSLLGDTLLKAAARGRRGTYIGDPDMPLTPMFIDDFARGLIRLADSPRALGEAWHIPTPEPTTGRQFSRLAYRLAGSRYRLGTLSSAQIRALGIVWPLAREGAEMIYQFEQPFISDASKFAAAFGAAPTAYERSIAATIDWYRSARA